MAFVLLRRSKLYQIASSALQDTLFDSLLAAAAPHYLSDRHAVPHIHNCCEMLLGHHVAHHVSSSCRINMPPCKPAAATLMAPVQMCQAKHQQLVDAAALGCGKLQ
jgi:hypothetical protein